MQFLGGLTIGTLVGAAGLLFVLNRIATTKPQPQYTKGRSDRQKVETALRYFGLIANRQSIGEARKIANKAMKEIGEQNAE